MARTSALLMRLLGKNSEYRNVPSVSQMRSSQTFLPLSSSRGREQKSISQLDAEGVPVWLTGLGTSSVASPALRILVCLLLCSLGRDAWKQCSRAGSALLSLRVRGRRWPSIICPGATC